MWRQVGKFGTAYEPGGWAALKPLTPWGELPILEGTPLGTIGHELQMLAFIAKKAGPALEGADEKEQMISMQLMAEAEDIYAKLGERCVCSFVLRCPLFPSAFAPGFTLFYSLEFSGQASSRTAAPTKTRPRSGPKSTRPSTTATRGSGSTSRCSRSSTPP